MARTIVWLAAARARLAWWGVVGALLGCSGSGLAPSTSAVGGPAQTTAVTVMGPGGASITVPPGASAAPVTIAITEAPATAPPLDPAVPRLSSVFAVTPHGASFDVPVTVQIPFDASGVSEETDLVVLQAEEGGQWKALPAVFVDLDAHTAQVAVTGFSYFVVTVRTLNTSGPAPTLTIAPVDPNFIQTGGGNWVYQGDPETSRPSSRSGSRCPEPSTVRRDCRLASPRRWSIRPTGITAST